MDSARRERFVAQLELTKQDIVAIDSNIEMELAKIKERLAELQNEKKAQLHIYDGYCQLLGIENDLAADEDEDEE